MGGSAAGQMIHAEVDELVRDELVETKDEPVEALEVVESVAEDAFQVTLSSMSGEQMKVSVSPSDTFSHFQRLVAKKLAWDAYWTLKFVHGSDSLDLSHQEKSMQELGISESSDLIVLKRDPWRIQNPGHPGLPFW